MKRYTRLSLAERGQYRLALRRFRFRYDVFARGVVLYYCGFRRGETYL